MVVLKNAGYRLLAVLVSFDIVMLAPVELHTKADPFHVRDVLETVGAVIKDVVPAAVWYGIWFADPPARLVAVPTESVL